MAKGVRIHRPEMSVRTQALSPTALNFRTVPKPTHPRSEPRVKSAGVLTESRREFERFGRDPDRNRRGSGRTLDGGTSTESLPTNGSVRRSQFHQGLRDSSADLESFPSAKQNRHGFPWRLEAPRSEPFQTGRSDAGGRLGPRGVFNTCPDVTPVGPSRLPPTRRRRLSCRDTPRTSS